MHLGVCTGGVIQSARIVTGDCESIVTSVERDDDRARTCYLRRQSRLPWLKMTARLHLLPASESELRSRDREGPILSQSPPAMRASAFQPLSTGRRTR